MINTELEIFFFSTSFCNPILCLCFPPFSFSQSIDKGKQQRKKQKSKKNKNRRVCVCVDLI